MPQEHPEPNCTSKIEISAKTNIGFKSLIIFAKSSQMFGWAPNTPLNAIVYEPFCKAKCYLSVYKTQQLQTKFLRNSEIVLAQVNTC